MFTKTKNIETAFQFMRSFNLVFLAGCITISCVVVTRSLMMIGEMQQRIYILDNAKAFEAYAADRKDNIPVEARDHIKTFHLDFFTLDPDEKVVTANITRALYLADVSAKKEYDNLKESGYYTGLISGNISQRLEVDSIEVSLDRYPYFFRLVGREKLIRTTSVLTRSLVTEGYLRNVARSDNDPHGFLIERWTIVENKDLKIENR